MSVESAEDRAVFLDSDEHGVEVTYTVAATMAVSIFDAIFENAYEGLAGGDFAEVASRAPQLTIQSSDLPAAGAEGDQVQFTARGVAYDYRRTGEIEHDGTGMALMRLTLP